MIFLYIMIFLFILSFSISLLVIGGIFITRYIKKHTTRKYVLILSSIGFFIGLLLFLRQMNVIYLWINYIPTEVTKIVYKTDNEIKYFDNIVHIERIITPDKKSSQYTGILKMYEKYDIDYQYNIVLTNISEQVNKIRFGSIKYCLDGNDFNIVSSVYMKKKQSISNDGEVIEEIYIGLYKTDYEIENNELLRIEIFYNLDLDPNLVDKVSIINDIDLELNNGEIINLNEKLDFIKAIEKTMKNGRL